MSNIGLQGEPWFVLNEVCAARELANSRHSASRLGDDKKGVCLSDTPGGIQEMAVSNEPGLYRLVMRSNKPAAHRFRKWVTAEVLPALPS